MAALRHLTLSHGLSVLVEDFLLHSTVALHRNVGVIFLCKKSLASRLLHLLLNELMLVEFLVSTIGVLFDGRAAQTTQVLDRLLRNLRLLLFQMLKLSLLVVG